MIRKLVETSTSVDIWNFKKHKYTQLWQSILKRDSG